MFGPFYGTNKYSDYAKATTLTSCYYNSDLFKMETYANTGTGLKTADFKNSSKFVGWDFENTWFIDEETGYPELKF